MAARRRRERSPANLKLKQPDRSGPTEKSLLELAEERGLWDQVRKREQELGKKAVPIPIPRPPKNAEDDGDGDDDDEDDGDGEDDDGELSPAADRALDTLLWTVSLAMLHFTLDVLVHHQYSVDRIVWPTVWRRFGQALFVFGLLVYLLHPHAVNPGLVPGLPPRYQAALRQVIFFITSSYAGCYLIHITNTSGYMAVMKQAPPLGCLWIWSTIELELPWAVLSLTGAVAFLWQRGYSIK
ncbi:hypothetical protein C8A05DRAFT_12699 [Staphylotrichum tortipilum]|uniref:DUF7719 domain-containing protein n=1 Tax=Staphylotrichum tortipilum TaxID=2831512 RepID=A0AAN6RWF3_9PEZI|nr:hypothetical protein C8A05DRAFT_12699 [Staphylotrichum longicolle]